MLLSGADLAGHEGATQGQLGCGQRERLAGELVSDLAAAYSITLATGDLLDAFERGEIDRTDLAAPI